jgi:type III pantothenate kinase
MNLSIDLGNTYAKTGLFENSKLLETNWKLTYTELIKYVQRIRPQCIMVSSVSYSEEQLRTEFADITNEIYLLKSTTPVPIKKLYDTPETLGADRVAAAVGARVLYPDKSCVVIDMGTCITYDLVGLDDNFYGGIISPGVRMRFKAMNTFTKRLPLLEPDGIPEAIPELIGKSTKHAMQSGVMNGILSEINGFVEEYSKVLTNINVILCGGDATYFANRIKNPNFVIPELVLIGLNRILEYNVKNQDNTEV